MIIIIPCGNKKQNISCQAKDMYIGNYFKTCLNYALSKTKPIYIYILSAKYGLIKLDTIIEPYNLHMKDSNIDIKLLSNQASLYGIINQIPIVIGGKIYIDKCKCVFKNIKQILPTNLGMGYQIQYLKRNTNENTCTIIRRP